MTERPVAWVTGANRGMGAVTARCLAGAGYDLVLSARDDVLLSEVAAEIEARGRNAVAVPCDLTDRAAVDHLADVALERFGRCDVLCNIGIYKGPSLNQLVEETSVDELQRHLDADLVAPFLLCRRALPWMREHGGTIVNMGSSSIAMDPPDTPHGSGWSFAYAAAKAGLDQLARLLQVEVGPDGVARTIVGVLAGQVPDYDAGTVRELEWEWRSTACGPRSRGATRRSSRSVSTSRPFARA